VTVPTVLNNVLAVGREADGALYVIDEAKPDLRAFVAVPGDGVLRRRAAYSFGEANGAFGPITVRVDEGATPFALGLDRSGGVARRMSIFHGLLPVKELEIGVQGDPLELVSPDVVMPLPVEDTAKRISVHGNAATPDGRRIVLVAPELGATEADYRVFVGRPERLLERHITEMAFSSSTFVTFDLDGTSATAIVSGKFNIALPPRLIVGSTSTPLSLLAADVATATAGTSYLCF
jgi:hypothetical protein